MTVDIKNAIAGARAAAMAGEQKIALELLERARNEILGDVWCSVSLDPKPFHEHDESDQELILCAVERSLRDNGGSYGPADIMVRATVAASKVRALGSVTDQLSIDLLRIVKPNGRLRRFSVYDSLYAADAPGDTGYIRMLTNRNVGDRRRTNVQIAECLVAGSDQWHAITGVRVSRPWDAALSLTNESGEIGTWRVDDMYHHSPMVLAPARPRSYFRLSIDYYEPVPEPLYVYIDGWFIE